MATIVLQQGHVPRRTGATGTHREQEAAIKISGVLAGMLRGDGHTVKVIGADDPVPASDAFIALHCDGSGDRARRGASVGYPDANGGKLAGLWKQEHSKIYDGGWHRDNYTTNLSGYYGFRRSSAKYRFLAEHCTNTNATDEAWLFSHIVEVAAAHRDALRRLFGVAAAPSQPAGIIKTIRSEGNMSDRVDIRIETDKEGCGWFPLPNLFSTWRSATAQGSYPPADGYWEAPVAAAQERDGRTIIVVTEGPKSTDTEKKSVVVYVVFDSP